MGRFSPGVTLPQGNNLPLSALGTLLIWFGWFGFNGGSTLIFNAQVPTVILTTCIAAAWGGVVATPSSSSVGSLFGSWTGFFFN